MINFHENIGIQLTPLLMIYINIIYFKYECTLKSVKIIKYY